MKQAGFLLCATLLSGCVSYGKQITPGQAARFEKGKATEGEVIATLGPPSTISRKSPDGTHTVIYTYSYKQMTAGSYLPIVSMFAGGTEETDTIVGFKFDADNHLIDWSSTLKDVGTANGKAKP